MKHLYLETEKNKIYISQYPLTSEVNVEDKDIIILICNKSLKKNELINFKKNIFYKQFLFLCNTKKEKLLCDKMEIYSVYINKNCFLDESLFKIIDNTEKIYDGIYVTSIKTEKRLDILKNTKNILIVKNVNKETDPNVNTENLNILDEKMLKEDLCKKYNQTLFGCIFSMLDYSSNVSSEYLLCGLPVITTTSYGGRDIWYNKYNHIMIDPNEDSFNKAINLCKEKINSGLFNPELIRRNKINLMLEFRLKFNKLICQLTGLGIEMCIILFQEKFDIFNKIVCNYSCIINEVIQYG
jgi:glycosyltransferase involved in cell wall biosynthesis